VRVIRRRHRERVVDREGAERLLGEGLVARRRRRQLGELRVDRLRFGGRRHARLDLRHRHRAVLVLVARALELRRGRRRCGELQVGPLGAVRHDGVRLHRLAERDRRLVEPGEQRADIGIVRIRIEHARVPPVRLDQVPALTLDVAHVAQRDQVLGIEVERGLEHAARLARSPTS
jgi:hypothetical protein